jgi:putative molybdopterin biosynthesis protein
MSAEMTKPPAASSRAAEQEQFLTILSREEALARFEAALFPRKPASEERALGDALGLALAHDVIAAVDVPPTAPMSTALRCAPPILRRPVKQQACGCR